MAWCLLRFVTARPLHKTLAAPVELDALLRQADQPSGLTTFGAQRVPHAMPEVQELIRTNGALPARTVPAQGAGQKRVPAQGAGQVRTKVPAPGAGQTLSES